MGAESDKIKRIVVKLAVYQHKVWFYMAVATILPLAAQWVIDRIWRKEFILDKEIDYRLQKSVQFLAVSTAFFPPVVSLEFTGVVNRPHSVL